MKLFRIHVATVVALLGFAMLAATGLIDVSTAAAGSALVPFAAFGVTNYVAEGDSLTLVAPYAVSSGQGAQFGANLFGVAIATYTSGQTGVFRSEGVFDLTKNTTGAFAVGDRLYWDNTNKRLTTTTTGNICVGIAVEAAATTAATGRIKLCETPIVDAGS